MKKLLGKSVLGLGCCLIGSQVQAQTAVGISYKEALVEFKGENYSKSIKLLETAVGLNEKDPSLWLLLGKSYYQMGRLEDAIKSFETTLQLAPNEKYAKTMLSRLVKNSGSVKQRLDLIKELLKKEYFTLAAAESALLQSLILTDKQKGELLFAKTRIAIGTKKIQDAVLFIEKLKNDHKDFDAPHKIKLIEASINLQSKNWNKVELAIQALDELSGHEEKEISSHASLLLLKHYLKEKVSLKNVAALTDWFDKNKESQFYLEICKTLIDLNKTLNTQLPARILSREDKKIFDLLEIYLKKEVLAQNRMFLCRDILKYFSTRYKKSKPPKEFTSILDKLLTQFEGKEGSYEILGRYQLKLLSHYTEIDVLEQRKIGLYAPGKAHELTLKFIKLTTSLLERGLIREYEAISFTENHLNSVTDGHDFKLRDQIWATVKAKVSSLSGLYIDLEMLHRRSDHYVETFIKGIKQGNKVPEQLPKEISVEFSRWLTLSKQIDSMTQTKENDKWKSRFDKLFRAGAQKAVVAITEGVKIDSLIAKRYFALYNASLKMTVARSAIRELPLKDAEVLKNLPAEMTAAIAGYTSVIKEFGKGDAISASQNLFSIINDLSAMKLYSFAAVEYGKAEVLFAELKTEKGAELAAEAAFFKEKSLFNKMYLDFQKNIQAEKPVTLDDSLKNVFSAHEAYLNKYSQSKHRLAIAEHFYIIALDFISLKQWDHSSGVLKLISESSVNPEQKERDKYLSLTARTGNALPDFSRNEITLLLRPPKAVKKRPKGKVMVQSAQSELQFLGDFQQLQIPMLTAKEKAYRKELFKQLIPELQKIINEGEKVSVKNKSAALILKIAASWNRYSDWTETVAVYRKFLSENPGKTSSRAQIRQSIVQALQNNLNKAQGTRKWKERVTELEAGLRLLREEYSSMSKDVLLTPSQRSTAAWELTQTFLVEARYVQTIKKSLSRSRYLRYSRELNNFVKNNFINSYRTRVPSCLKSLGDEMSGLGFYQEAIDVYQLLYSNYPGHRETHAAGLMMAQVYRNNLKQPIKAAEVYLEMNYTFANGNSLQNEIFKMASKLKSEKRWIESLHIFEVFTASFPKHPTAGHAMEMIGEIHQANESWEEAITAYNKVIAHCNSGSWIKEARWAIADCYIQLSNWGDALKAYRDYEKEYQKDGRKSELARRIAVLKDLGRYQVLVDEEGQRKSFDAQFQIATIVRDRLSLHKKAAKEFQKVYEKWPKAHLADDALYQRGVSLMASDLVDQARASWNLLGEKYGGSPLADDALFLVGKSFEDESVRLAKVDRSDVLKYNKARVQNEAYLSYYGGRAGNRKAQKKKIINAQEKGDARDADILQASNINQQWAFDNAYVTNTLQNATRQVEAYTAIQLADQQDKVNAALRKAIGSYNAASAIASADKAGEALLRMAGIYDEKLNNSAKAMVVWKETVRQFSGTSVAEDASWKIARYYEHNGNYKNAIDADKSFLRNYRRSAKAELAQFAIAEHFEHLSDWVSAMDAYTNYIKNYPKGKQLSKAKEQINWIKTYRL